MRILVVKLASLGDIVHAMPAMQDIRRALPQARIDWLVDASFAPLVKRVEGIAQVIALPLHRWKDSWWAGHVRSEYRAARERLARERYDAVIDLQGITQSAVLARLAPLAAGGHRFGAANGGDSLEWDLAARWLVDISLRVDPKQHPVERARSLCAQALRYKVEGPPRHGLPLPRQTSPGAPTVVFVHGSNQDPKLWPQTHWITLGKRVLGQGWRIALPQRNEAEQTRAEMIAAALQFERAPLVEVWPTLKLDAVLDRFAAVQGVIGIDTALSDFGSALGLPQVQILNAGTGRRPDAGSEARRRVAVEGHPMPTADAVWSAWQSVMPSTPARPS